MTFFAPNRLRISKGFLVYHFITRIIHLGISSVRFQFFFFILRNLIYPPILIPTTRIHIG